MGTHILFDFVNKKKARIGQWGSNGLPSVILGSPFWRKGVQERWSPRRYLSLLVQTVPWEKERSLTLCRHIGTFWATEKAWAQITAESRMFVLWNNDSNEEEKGNRDSKRLKKLKWVYRAAVKSVLLSVMFSNTLFEKRFIGLLNQMFCGSWHRSIHRSIFFAPNLTRQRKFYAAFFPNWGNPARSRSRINPERSLHSKAFHCTIVLKKLL